MPSRPPLSRLLDGPPPALPAVLDTAAERWSRLRPRARFLLVALLVAALATGLTARLAASPWGPPVPVLVAVRHLDVGEPVTADAVRVVRWPASVVPPGSLTAPAEASGTLVAPVAAGLPVTAGHLGEGGVAALVAEGHIVVPLLRDTLPLLAVGTRVDVIAADHDLRGSQLAADARVLAVDDHHLWVEVPRDAAPDVAAAGLRGAVVLAVVAPDRPAETPGGAGLP